MIEKAETADLIWLCVHAEVNFVGCDIPDEYVSVPRAEWDAMTDDEQNKYCVDMASNHLANYAGSGASVVDASEVPAEYVPGPRIPDARNIR